MVDQTSNTPARPDDALRGGVTINPESVAQLFDSQLTADYKQREASRASQLWAMLEKSSSADISATVRRADAKERAEGKQAPLVEVMVKHGMTKEVAQVRLSEVRNIIAAFWSGKGFRPNPGEGWHDVVTRAREVNGEKRKEDRAVNAKRRERQEIGTLFMSERDRIEAEAKAKGLTVTPEAIAHAADAARAMYDQQQRDAEESDVVTSIIQKFGFERSQRVLSRLQTKLSEMAQQQAEGKATETPQGAVQPAAERTGTPQRQVA
jgi:hypothetical protein